MKRLLRKFRLIGIDVFIYHMTHYKEIDMPKFIYDIQYEKKVNKSRFFVMDKNILVHESYLFKKVFLLKSINESGPVIGDCYTNKAFRGQSIYPIVINSIAKKLLTNDYKKVFVIVNQSNMSSIKGIEKAGFSKLASIKATRWLWFYFKRRIIYFE